MMFKELLNRGCRGIGPLNSNIFTYFGLSFRASFFGYVRSLGISLVPEMLSFLVSPQHDDYNPYEPVIPLFLSPSLISHTLCGSSILRSFSSLVLGKFLLFKVIFHNMIIHKNRV